jgi:2-polyprenyl-3-methyl-5-hydroxy-6-metoxy-1,4-benzoquinol methylase
MKFRTTIEQRLSARHKKCLEIADYNNKKILDIGCSYGWFEKLIENKAKEIVAIDPSKVDLESARKETISKKVKFILGSSLELNKLNVSGFDVAVMFDVIEHIPKNSEIKTFKEINLLLKNGGQLVISTPANNISNIFDPAWYFGHRHYSKDKLSELLIKSGFKIKKLEIKGGFFEIFSMILFYPFKWIFNMEIPFKAFFDKKRDEEYLRTKDGMVTLFAIAQK